MLCPVWNPATTAMHLWRRNEVQEQWVLRIPWDTLGETFAPSWSASGRGGIAAPGTKEPVNTVALPYPLSTGAETPAEGG